MNRRILVLGATGSFGAGVAQELLRRGQSFRCLVRSVEKTRRVLGKSPALELIEGDVQDPKALAQAVEGCGAVVHSVNYPCPEWIPHMETATFNVIEAARNPRATIFFPGNVYNLGLQTAAPLTEDAAHLPNSKKGKLRAQIEDSLKRAAEDGGLRVIVLRAGDYFGFTVRNGLVDPIFGNAARGKPLQALGNLNIPHQWAFVPDLARAGLDLLRLADRLRPFEIFHFAGYLANPQREFFRLVGKEAGSPHLGIRRAPWWVLRIVGLFNGVVRELMELRYLFDGSVVLEGSRLQPLLPDFHETLIEEAVGITLASYR